jgi:hypothetical protein
VAVRVRSVFIFLRSSNELKSFFCCCLFQN